MIVMAPQGFFKHANAFEADIFSLPVNTVKAKKRKSKELNPNAPVFKRKKERTTLPDPQQPKPEPEIVLIDSDNETEKPRPDLVTISDSDDDSVKVYEPKKEIIELNDSETDDGNLIININQTESVDKIVDSALGRSAKDNKFDEDGINVVAKSKERLHWTQVNGYPKSWTKEMIRFYTEPCDEKRNFDYVEILKKLKTKPSDWRINRADMMGSNSKRRSHEVCRRCDKFGHTAQECRKNIVCYVCGGFNHRFPKCPNTICFTCGKPAFKNLVECDDCEAALEKKEPCGLCQQVSHEEYMCPSKWRKHLLLDSSNQTLQLNPKRSCYNCGGKGHFGFDCPMTQSSQYPLENPLLTASPDNPLSTAYHTDCNLNNVIFVPHDTETLLRSDEGDAFLRRVSNDTKCRIEFFQREQNPYIRIIGEEDQVKIFKDELEKLKHNTS